MTKIEHTLLSEQTDINESLLNFENNLRNVSRYLVGDAPPQSTVTPDIPDNSGSPLLSQLHYGNMDIRSKISSINEVLSWIRQMSGYDDNVTNLKSVREVQVSDVITVPEGDFIAFREWRDGQVKLSASPRGRKAVRPAPAKRPYTRKAKKAARR